MPRVLIVDDSRSIRNILSTTLIAQGYNVFEASSCEEALATLCVTEVDVVVTDLHMSNGDGIELTHQIRDMELHHNTPILFLTTDSDSHTKEKARMAGASGWILKPVRGAKLVEIIEKVIEVWGSTFNERS